MNWERLGTWGFLFNFFQHMFTQEGDIWLIQFRKCCKYHLKIVFPRWRNPFHHLPPTAFPEPFLFIPWLSWWQWDQGCGICTNQIKCTRSNIYSGDCVPILHGLTWQKVGCSWACSLCTSTFLWSSLSYWSPGWSCHVFLSSLSIH